MAQNELSEVIQEHGYNTWDDVPSLLRYQALLEVSCRHILSSHLHPDVSHKPIENVKLISTRKDFEKIEMSESAPSPSLTSKEQLAEGKGQNITTSKDQKNLSRSAHVISKSGERPESKERKTNRKRPNQDSRDSDQPPTKSFQFISVLIASNDSNEKLVEDTDGKNLSRSAHEISKSGEIGEPKERSRKRPDKDSRDSEQPPTKSPFIPSNETGDKSDPPSSASPTSTSPSPDEKGLAEDLPSPSSQTMDVQPLPSPAKPVQSPQPQESLTEDPPFPTSPAMPSTGPTSPIVPEACGSSLSSSTTNSMIFPSGSAKDGETAQQDISKTEESAMIEKMKDRNRKQLLKDKIREELKLIDQKLSRSKFKNVLTYDR